MPVMQSPRGIGMGLDKCNAFARRAKARGASLRQGAMGRDRIKTPDGPVKDPRTARGKGGWTNATICPQGEGAMGRDRINFANHTADSSLNRRFASKFGFDSAPQFPRKARKPSNRTSYFVHPLVHHTHNYAC